MNRFAGSGDDFRNSARMHVWLGKTIDAMEKAEPEGAVRVEEAPFFVF